MEAPIATTTIPTATSLSSLPGSYAAIARSTRYVWRPWSDQADAFGYVAAAPATEIAGSLPEPVHIRRDEEIPRWQRFVCRVPMTTPSLAEYLERVAWRKAYRQARLAENASESQVFDQTLGTFYTPQAPSVRGVIYTTPSSKPLKRLQKARSARSRLENEMKSTPPTWKSWVLPEEVKSLKQRCPILLARLRAILATFSEKRTRGASCRLPRWYERRNNSMMRNYAAHTIASQMYQLRKDWANIRLNVPNPDIGLSNLDDIPMIPCGNGQVFDVNLRADDTQVQMITDTIANASEKLLSKFSEKARDWKHKAIQIVTHATSAMTAHSKVTWFTSAFGILHTLELVNTDSLNSLVGLVSDSACKVGELLDINNILPTGTGQMAPPKSKTDIELEKYTRIATVLWQALGTTLSLKSCKAKPQSMVDYGKLLMEACRNEAKSTQGFISFFTNLIVVVRGIFEDLMVWWNPQLKSLMDCEYKSIMMETWVKEVVDLLKIFNNANLQLNQGIVNRLEAVLTTAQQFLADSARDEHSVPRSFVNMVLKYYSVLNEKMQICLKRGFCSATRYTPFCLYMYGRPGVGKSEATTRLMSIFQDVYDLKHETDLVFTKPSVSEFFTNCGHQPICVFDDFEQIAHTNPAQGDAANMIYLKSSAPYNPPMAAVEDKSLMYSPKVLIVLSNQGYPRVSYIACPEALWRRRDVLVEVKLKDGITLEYVKSLDPSNDSWDHVIFHVKTDPRDPNSLGRDYTYNDFVVYLRKEATAYHKRESALLRARLDKLEKLQKEADSMSLEHRYGWAVTRARQENFDEFEREMKTSAKTRFMNWLSSCKEKLNFRPKPVTAKKGELVTLLAKYVNEPNEADIRSYLDNLEEIEKKHREGRARAIAEFGESVDRMCAEPDEGPQPLDISDLENFNVRGDVQMPTIEDGKVEEAAEVHFPEGTTWHDGFDTKCAHTETANFFNTKYSVPMHAFITPAGEQFSVYHCEKGCVFDAEDARQYLLANYSRVDRDLCKVNCSIKKSQNKGLCVFDAYKEKTLLERMRCVLERVCKAISTPLKYLLKALFFVSMIILPFLALIGVVIGATALGKWHSSKKTDNPKTFSSSWSEAVDEASADFANTFEYQRAISDQIIFNAARIRELNAQLGQGENNPYQVVNEAKLSGSKPRVSVAHARAQHDISHLYAILRRNTFFLSIWGRNKHTGADVHVKARGFGIRGRWAMIPVHYIHAWQKLDITDCYYINGTENVKINMKAITRVIYPSHELCLVQLPSISSFKTVLHHFAEEKDWCRVLPREIVLAEVDDLENLTLHKDTHILHKEFTICDDGIALATIGPVIQYSLSRPGLCMTPVLSSSGKIIGFHIAGNKKFGFAEPVVRSSFEDSNMPALSELKEILHPLGDGQQPELQIDTSIQILGKVKTDYVRYETGKTHIGKSIIHGTFPITATPAPLRACPENQFTDPLAAGVRKHGLPCYGFDVNILKIAKSRFRDMLLNRCTPIFDTVRVWSEKEACNGVASIPNLQAIVLQTSEGFPYCFERPQWVDSEAPKQWLLNRVTSNDGNHDYNFHPRLREILDKKNEMRSANISPRSVFVDCLKDARLPIAKVNIPGKVRIFSISPVDFIIQYRQHFADFIAAYVSSRGVANHAIGITPEKLDWTDLAFKLQSKGPKILCGDYSNFGPAFAVDVHDAVNDEILNWYHEHGATEEEQRHRRILMHEMSSAVHLARDCLYEVPCGMPSGSPETAMKNSCVNTMYIYYMWYYIMHKVDPKLSTFDAMEKNMYFVTYGDDFIANISDEVSEHFNNETLQNAFAEHGVKYTDDMKGDTIRKWCTLSEATFLKRKFVVHPRRKNTIMSALDLPAARDVSNWIHKNKLVSPEEASLEASYQALSLAYGSGECAFNETRKQLSEAWRSRGVKTFTPRSWQDFDDLYFGAEQNSMAWYEALPKGDVRDTELCGDGQMAEMMETPVGGNISHQTEDTILQTHDIPVITADRPVGVETALLATTDRIVQMPKLTNRQIVLANLTWSSTDDLGKEIWRCNLPNDGVVAGKLAPNWKMLDSFAYYRPKEITLTVSINSNKFSSGQLQLSAYYDAHLDGAVTHRENVYVGSQMLHTLIDAGSSNSVQLKIPFKHYNPWLKISSSSDYDQFVRVYLRVLVPYITPDTVAKQATLVITWSMDDTDLMGMRPTLLLSDGQMLPMAASLAMQYLQTKFSDKNRDKPPVQLNSSTLEPRATGTLALGTNVCEHLNALRLDATAQVPHPDGSEFEDSFSEYAQRYGLLKQITWTKDDASGVLLYQSPAGPLLDLDFYKSKIIQASPEIKAYYIPPCDVISALFDQYSGGVKYRIDVVGSQMHTGSIMCVFIPGYTASAAVPYDTAKYAYNVVYDIHEQRTFEFEMPFVCDKPWWPVLRLDGSDDNRIVPYGSFFIYVVNPLIPMANVAQSLTLNLYKGGSSNLKFSIPVQPQLALPWYIMSGQNPEDGTVFAKTGYYPFYVGQWEWFFGGKGLCLRWGTLANRIAQFDYLVQGFATTGEWCYYTYDQEAIDPQWAQPTYRVSAKDSIFIPLDVKDGYGLVYMAVVEKSFDLSKLFEKPYVAGASPNWSNTEVPTQDPDSTWGVDKNLPFTRHLYTPKTLHDFEIIGHGQMPDPRVGLTTVETPASETHPLLEIATYGENFMSVKNLLRRYEYVDSIIVNNSPTSLINETALSFFAAPSGHAIDINNLTFDSCRDGTHALILSGFRYFRGSMNYKLAIIDGSGSLWVQHHPDSTMTSAKIQRLAPKKTSQCYQNGYASAIGAIKVNPIITVNVPFYNPNSFVLLQSPDLTQSSERRRAMSLGEVQAGLNSPTLHNRVSNLHLYKSIGDDASPSTFVGFPPCVPRYIYNVTKKK